MTVISSVSNDVYCSYHVLREDGTYVRISCRQAEPPSVGKKAREGGKRWDVVLFPTDKDNHVLDWTGTHIGYYDRREDAFNEVAKLAGE